MKRFFLVLVLLLAGCGSSDKSAGGAATSTTSTTSTTAVVSGFAPVCTAGLVTLSASKPTAEPNTGDQFGIVLSFENRGKQACSLQGIPTVMVKGPDNAVGSTYTVHSQQKVDAPVVILKPSEKAVSTLTYLSATTESATCTDGKVWKPTAISVTLPGSTQLLTVDWPGDTMDNCQGGATHPGDYVSPFTHA